MKGKQGEGCEALTPRSLTPLLQLLTPLLLGSLLAASGAGAWKKDGLGSASSDHYGHVGHPSQATRPSLSFLNVSRRDIRRFHVCLINIWTCRMVGSHQQRRLAQAEAPQLRNATIFPSCDTARAHHSETSCFGFSVLPIPEVLGLKAQLPDPRDWGRAAALCHSPPSHC